MKSSSGFFAKTSKPKRQKTQPSLIIMDGESQIWPMPVPKVVPKCRVAYESAFEILGLLCPCKRSIIPHSTQIIDMTCEIYGTESVAINIVGFANIHIVKWHNELTIVCNTYNDAIIVGHDLTHHIWNKIQSLNCCIYRLWALAARVVDVAEGDEFILNAITHIIDRYPENISYVEKTNYDSIQPIKHWN